MPISNRARRRGWSGVTPARPSSRIDQVWPAVITLPAVIMFIVFLVWVGLSMAVFMALTTLAAAAILVTLVTGTAWPARLRRLAPHLRGHR